jgi:hypothetical protein
MSVALEKLFHKSISIADALEYWFFETRRCRQSDSN